MLEYLQSPRLWLSAGVIVVCIILQISLKHVEQTLLHSPRFHNVRITALRVAIHVTRIVLAMLAILAILQVNGVNVSSILTGLGVTGIVVGFALQDVLKDMAMGINIVTRSFLHLGDVIEYEGSYWEVSDLSIRFLYLQNIYTDETYIVSNRNISEIRIQPDYQNIIIPGNYSVPVERMREICEEIARRSEKIPEVTRCEFQGTEAFENSSVSYYLQVYGKPKERFNIHRAVNGVIQDVFAENNIEIPVNQVDIRMNR